MKCIVLYINGAHRPEQLSTLKDLQTAVGGDIEVLHLYDLGLDMIVNEEGKLQGLPLNKAASAIARTAIQLDDFVVGNAVICGPVDDDGNGTDVTDEMVRTINTLAAFANCE